MPRSRLFVLSAPSGTGKSTLIDRAVNEIPRIWHSVSATTRKPRPYENEGVHYIFMARETFRQSIEKNLFLEWAEVHGEYYGTPADAVNKHLNNGEVVIMDLDVRGALHVKKHRPDAQLIFIMPPSLDTLRKRIEGRRTESDESIQRRLSVAEKEMAYKEQYDFVIVNNVLDDAFRELENLILGHSNPKGEVAS